MSEELALRCFDPGCALLLSSLAELRELVSAVGLELFSASSVADLELASVSSVAELHLTVLDSCRARCLR